MNSHDEPRLPRRSFVEVTHPLHMSGPEKIDGTEARRATTGDGERRTSVASIDARQSSARSSFSYGDESDPGRLHSPGESLADMASTTGQRLLQRYNVLGLQNTIHALNDLAQAAGTVANVPCAIVMLYDWMKKEGFLVGSWGLNGDNDGNIAAVSSRVFCRQVWQTIQHDAFFEFDDSEISQNDPTLCRFHAGAIIRSPSGYPLGTLCVLDRVSRALTDSHRRQLTFLAKAVTTTLEKNARASSRRQSAESAPPSAQSLAPATFSNPPSLAGSSSAPHYAFGGPRSSQSHGNGAVSPYVPQSSSSAEHTGGTADRADRGPSGGGRKPSSMGTSASWRELPMSDLGEMAMPGQPVSKPKLDGSSERLASIVARAHFEHQLAYCCFRFLISLGLLARRAYSAAAAAAPAAQAAQQLEPPACSGAAAPTALALLRPLIAAVLFDAAIAACALALHRDNARRQLRAHLAALQAAQALAVSLLLALAAPANGSLADWASRFFSVALFWVSCGLASPAQIAFPELVRAALDAGVELYRRSAAGALTAPGVAAVALKGCFGFVACVLLASICWQGGRVQVFLPDTLELCPRFLRLFRTRLLQRTVPLNHGAGVDYGVLLGVAAAGLLFLDRLSPSPTAAPLRAAAEGPFALYLLCYPAVLGSWALRLIEGKDTSLDRMLRRFGLSLEATAFQALLEKVEEAGMGEGAELFALQAAADMMSKAVPEADAIVVSTFPTGDGAPLYRFAHTSQPGSSLEKALLEVAEWTAANTEEHNGTSVAFALGSGGLLVVDSRDFANGTLHFSDWAAARMHPALKRDIAVTCLLNSAGLPVGFATFYITRQMMGAVRESVLLEKIESEASFLGFTLGHLRAERAKALQRHITEEMRISKELAEGTVALQRSFISHMTHELRTPLNAVIAFNSLCLEGGNLTPTDREYLRSSLTSGQQLLGVINQILEYAKLESTDVGGLELNIEQFSLLDIVSDLTDIAGPKATGKNVYLVIDADPALFELALNGDAFRLRQTLINITDNATKFTNAGGQVVVRVTPIEAGSAEFPARDTHGWPLQWVEFSVQDTGDGMPLDQQHKLFRPFSQIKEGAGPSKAGGTGLGLVITKRIIEAFGGSISFVSAPGVGTTFFVKIPFVVGKLAGADPTLPPPPAAVEAESLRPNPLPRVQLEKPVVVAIAHPALRAMVLRLLESWGVRAVEADVPYVDADGTAIGADGSPAAESRALTEQDLVTYLQASVRGCEQTSALDGTTLIRRGGESSPLPAAPEPLILLTEFRQLRFLASRGVLFPHPVISPVVLGGYGDRDDMLKELPSVAGDLFLTRPVKVAALLERLRKADAWSSLVVASGASITNSERTTSFSAGSDSHTGGRNSQPGRANSFADPTSSMAAAAAAALAFSDGRDGAGIGQQAGGFRAGAQGGAALSSPEIRLLCAEDNPVNRKVAQAVLARCGITPAFAVDGVEALEAYEKSLAEPQPFDVIFMDIQMPRMSGLEATEAIRRLERERLLPPVHIIALSASTSTEDKEQAFRAGVNDYVPKPIYPEVVRLALQRWADGRNAHRPS